MAEGATAPKSGSKDGRGRIPKTVADGKSSNSIKEKEKEGYHCLSEG